MLYLPQNHWANQEFEDLDFGDARLNDRFLKTAYFMSEKPGFSIFGASQSRSQMKGAYRMFANEKVTTDEIFSVHQDKTIERIKAASGVVLAIQDTTFLNYNDHLKTQGLGHIGSVGGTHNQGLIMHSCLAYDISQGTVLGFINQEIWARKKKPLVKSPRQRKLLPIEKKESMKWLSSLRVSHDVLSDLKKKIVCVADRECDIFEFLQECNILNENFVIRAVRNRKVLTEAGYSLIWDEVLSQKIAGRMDIWVPARAGKKKRLAQIEIKYCSLLIKPTQERPLVRNSPPVQVYGILAKELRPPKDGSGLEWMLLTNLEIKSFAEAAEKINWYKSRWQIEIFHKILKSICRVESCGFRTAEQLKKFITMESIAAWRLHWMNQTSRSNPNQSCTEILEDYEWKILRTLITNKSSQSSHAPTMRQAVHWIAQLGGFIGRKSDGDPGTITLSKGWIILKNTINHWIKLKEIERCG